MKGNSDGEKSNGVENLMIVLDNMDYHHEQEKKENFQENNKLKLKKHKKLQKNKDKQNSKHQNLELLNLCKYNKKEKMKVIIIEENDNQESIKDLKQKVIPQLLEKQIITQNKEKIQKQYDSSFQENLREKQQISSPKFIKETEMQTDNKCDIKKLEIFHLLKISQNFILSMHSLTEKIIKMYV
ncbi:unnamed protein product [Paramecium sonneborni]|uniref:Uncharacterized protein n=1 Tax=Paramecium sonneborni TaxID=65129 RepID=A0A8S1KUN0_9CILI|nr:unnamed protein product [Paramecium sonneborni]